jgi:L-alanine-DL-glutamate epimerase-like enolase superfamily enzyme
LHLCCAIPNTRYYEVLVINDPKAERNEHGELGIDNDGYVHIPQRPGIGWQIDVGELAKEAVMTV